MKKTKRAVCYIRTANPTEDFRTNLTKIKEYCESNGITLSDSDIFVDENVSGTIDVEQRKGLSKMVERLKTGDIDIVLAYRLDQLFRNQRKLLAFVEYLTKHNVAFVSTTETFSTSEPSGRLMLQMLGSFAEHEREMIKARGGKCCCCGN